MLTSARQPAVSGMFYPADASELRSVIKRLLDDAATTAACPKAIIVPHAGYIYSGPIAASAYARVANARTRISRVVLLGPSHRVPLFGLAASSATHFITPLGAIDIDETALERLRTLPQVKVLDEAHRLEHSLEVHLPFLQMTIDQFTLVPLVVGDAEPHNVAEVLDVVWGGPETLIVVSSDLSHYKNYAMAQRLDRATSDAIERGDCEALDDESACGRIPVKGLLYAAKARGLYAHTIDLRNSGDTAGPRDQVVGYGAYVFDERPAH